MSSPGWYPDPDPNAPATRQRYWDGSAWTEQLRGPQEAADSSPPSLTKNTGGPHPSAPTTDSYGAQSYGNQNYGNQGYGDQGLAAQGHQGYPPYGPGQPGYAVPGPTHLSDGTALSSVWKRLGAAVIDTVIVTVLFGLAALVTIGVPALIGGGIDAGSGSGAGAGLALGIVLGYVLTLVVWSLSYFWYYLLRVRKVGATFGKQWLNLQIRDWHRTGQLTWGQVLSRGLLVQVINSFTSGLFGLIDALWCLWDPHRQTLHDKMAGTVVVDHSVPRAGPGSAEVSLAAAHPPAPGWIAQGPEPVSPAGYPHAT